MKTILLATGYEVEETSGHLEHLTRAILGEMILRPVNEGLYSFDDGLRLALAECDRLSKAYSIPYRDLTLRFFRCTLDTLEMARGASDN